MCGTIGSYVCKLGFMGMALALCGASTGDSAPRSVWEHESVQQD